jgi:NAD(P)-dependent dehydrogenase (short-subunit alcohol dehydrogenase family)
MTRLRGKVALVTGASSGTGRAIARRLAADGAAVVCGDLRPTPVPNGLDGDEPTHSVITAVGGAAAYVACDVGAAESCAHAVDFARDRYGRIDIVVANAGVGVGTGSLPDKELDDWQHSLDVNLTGTWNTIRFGLRALVDQGEGGRIITMSSVVGLVALPDVPYGYAATKAGVIQLTRQAAVRGAPHGITANTVCPGVIRTAINRTVWADEETNEKFVALHPLGRLGETSDVAGAVAFLASPDAAWITGVTLPVDGGLTCV